MTRRRSTIAPSAPARGRPTYGRPRWTDKGARHLYLQPVRAPDDVEHDLVRARADPVQAHVAPHALDAVLLHVARAAVDLDALVGDLDRDARGVELRHRDLADGVLAVLEAPCRHVHELARRLDLRRHLRELVADDLELADLAPERGALLRVPQRLLEAALGAG